MKSNQEKAALAPEELWRSIEEGAEDDEMDRILALSPEQLDAELTAAGFDPAKERALGFEQARQAVAIVAAEETHREERRDAAKRLDARRKQRGVLDVATLMERIDLARNDARLPQAAAILFRNRAAAESTREELEAILDELEDLIEAHERTKTS